MANKDENEAINALTGFSLNHILDGLSLPGGAGLSNQLGIAGVPTLSARQIYNDNFDDEGAIGNDQGEDWEAQIDQEMENEMVEEVKPESRSPKIREKQKRVHIVKRLVQRPKSVYERFPAFEKDKILEFSELFKGVTITKSRLSKRPFHSKSCARRLSGAALIACL